RTDLMGVAPDRSHYPPSSASSDGGDKFHFPTTGQSALFLREFLAQTFHGLVCALPAGVLGGRVPAECGRRFGSVPECTRVDGPLSRGLSVAVRLLAVTVTGRRIAHS